MRAITPYGRSAGSSRVRLYHWLERTGLNAEIHDYMGLGSNGARMLARRPFSVVKAEWHLRELEAKVRGDIVFLQKEASPFSNGAIECRLLEAAGRAIFDIDDALFHDRPSLPPASWLVDIGKFARIAGSADVVIAGNEYLAEWAAGVAGGDVTVVPSCIEPAEYRYKRAYELHDPPIIVWMGQPVSERYLSGIDGALREVSRRTGARVRIIGATEGPVACGGDNVYERSCWDQGTWPELLAASDVGIMPMADGELERGKCGYKLLQYGAAGLPFIASPVGVNRDICRVADMPTASSEQDWVESLLMLLHESPSRREERAKGAYSAICTAYSYGRWEGEWLKAVLG